MMKYLKIFLVLCLCSNLLSGQEHESINQEEQSGVAGEVPKHTLRNTLFGEIDTMLDHWTMWLNPVFEKPLSALPGLSSVYPSFKGYIKGFTIAALVIGIIRSRPIKNMIKTIKEWYAVSEDDSLRFINHDNCSHPCMICSSMNEQ